MKAEDEILGVNYQLENVPAGKTSGRIRCGRCSSHRVSNTGRRTEAGGDARQSERSVNRNPKEQPGVDGWMSGVGGDVRQPREDPVQGYTNVQQGR